MIISLGSSEKHEDEEAVPSGSLPASSSLNGDVATLEESSQSSGSTGSWDMAEFVTAAETSSASDTTATTSVQTEDLGAQLKVVETEQELALLKNQVETLRAENLEKSKKMEQQNGLIQDLTDMISEKDELVDENAMKTTLLECQETKIMELVKEINEKDAENAMKTTLLECQEAKIKELAKEINEKDAVKEEQVTDKFYESEEEIALLRKEIGTAAEVINAVLLATDILRKKQELRECSKAVETFNVLWEGADSGDASKLKTLASEFADFVVDQDGHCAVAFWADADNHDYKDEPAEEAFVETTIRKCWNVVRTQPTLLLESKLLDKWSAVKIENDLFQLETDEYTKFCILHRWCLWNKEERYQIGKRLARRMALERIDPLKLSTTVRSSGLVSDSELCDAFGKQAADKSLVENKRNVTPPKDPVPPNNCADFEHTWDTSGSTVLSSSGQWKTGRISSNPLKDTGAYMWKIRVEEQGGILSGVTSSSCNHEKDDISKFGRFLKCCECEKGDIIFFSLKPSLLGPGTIFQASTRKWMKNVVLSPAMTVDDLLFTVSVQNGASVKFLCFCNCTD